MNLSNRLKYLRKRTGLNQLDIAKKLDMARATYGAYEQGNRNPDYETLKKMADFFDVTTDYLLGRVEDPNDIMNVAYSRGGHNFSEEEKKELDAILENEVEKFLRLRKQFLKSKEDDK